MPVFTIRTVLLPATPLPSPPPDKIDDPTNNRDDIKHQAKGNKEENTKKRNSNQSKKIGNGYSIRTQNMLYRVQKIPLIKDNNKPEKQNCTKENGQYNVDTLM